MKPGLFSRPHKAAEEAEEDWVTLGVEGCLVLAVWGVGTESLAPIMGWGSLVTKKSFFPLGLRHTGYRWQPQVDDQTPLQ